MTDSTSDATCSRPRLYCAVLVVVIGTLALTFVVQSRRADRIPSALPTLVPPEFMVDLQIAADNLRAHWHQTGTIEGSGLLDRWRRPYIVRRVPASETLVQIVTLGQDGMPHGTGYDHDLWIEVELASRPAERVGE